MSTPSSLLRSLSLVVLTSLPALAQSVTATVTAATQLIVTAGTNTNTRAAGTNLGGGLNLGTSYQSGPIFVTVNSVFGLSTTSTSITHTIQESMTGVNATRSAGPHALKQTDDAASDGGIRAMLDGCVDTVIIDLNANPHTMFIDFGPTNCQGTDGRYRRRSLMVTFTGGYSDPGTVITITPQDYYVNDYRVQGTKTVTNMGADTNGNTYFTVEVAGTITAPNNQMDQHAQRKPRAHLGGRRRHRNAVR